MQQRRRYNKTPSRRKVPGTGAQTKLVSRTPIIASEANRSGNDFVVAFDCAVVSNGIPQWTTGAGAVPITVAENTPTNYTLHYAASIVAEDITIPFEDPAFRNAAGGYVLPTIFVGS
jgi:3-hydroxy-3-methylglutaryl CoA synthase